MTRRHAPAAARNAQTILALLEQLLPTAATVLEIGSGTGEHAVLFARHLPWITWQPSDPDEASRASIAAWTALGGVGNVRPPLHLDLLAPAWRLRRADAVVAINVLHLLPAAAADALLEGALEVLPSGGRLVVGGSFARRGVPLGSRLARLDGQLRERGLPGLPRLEDLAARARSHDLAPEMTTALPDGGALLVARRG